MTDPTTGEIGELVERLIAEAWAWGHGCAVDDIGDRATIGDSYNEGGRDATAKAATVIGARIAIADREIEHLKASRDRTRAALEAMRAERDTLSAYQDRIERLEAEITRAVAAEREACARLAREHMPERNGSFADLVAMVTARSIADAIRSRTPADTTDRSRGQ